MQVLDAGWLAFFEDPTGASFAIWQSGRHRGAERVHEPGALCWNELATRDVPMAREFYGRLFGWDFAEVPLADATYVMIKHGGGDIGGIVAMDAQWEGIPPHWMAYFAVDDVNATVERIRSTGGRVSVPPTDIQVGIFSVVSDPQGATFSVIQLKAPAG